MDDNTVADGIHAAREALEQAVEREIKEDLRLLNERCGDANACRAILFGDQPVKKVIGPLSTSEAIVVALAFGRMDLLPRAYRNFRDAWRRLDARQRHLVDIVARLPWSAREESFPN
jgi:hypothetical protein